jgi:superfamily II DNA/RNA helicase
MKEKQFLPLVKERLGIAELNDMQKEVMATASTPGDIMLLSPTGSGKTLAFTLPMLKLLKEPTGRVQAVVIAPTRELVMQIYEIVRSLAQGFKVTPLYGGHNAEDEKNSLAAVPDIIVATPGRLLDHSQRGNIHLLPVRIVILDEFDKSLELGFEKEMKKLMDRMKNVSRVTLTSATDMPTLPDYIKTNNLRRFSYHAANKDLKARMRIYRVESSEKDKLQTLRQLLLSIVEHGDEKTLIFVNYRESAERVAQSLHKLGVNAGLYHGALDQHDREKAITLFNNGTRPILVATDLAARGLDIEEVKNIVHYHQPLTPDAYIHRNGRTARVADTGDVYTLIGPGEDVKEFVDFDGDFFPSPKMESIPTSGVVSVYISAGKKEKLSRGDIVGFLVNQGGYSADEIGKIALRDHYSLVGVKAGATNADDAERVAMMQLRKIKGVKRKITLIR